MIQYNSWISPSFEEEFEEFKAPWWNFSQDELDELKAQLIDPFYTTLDDFIWSGLQNTDSWDTTDLRQVIKLAANYGKSLESILERFINGEPLPTPIVLLQDNSYHLIAGNTRLMLCRALGIRPIVALVSLTS